MKTKIYFCFLFIPVLFSFKADQYVKKTHKEIDIQGAKEVITDIGFAAGRIKINAEEMESLFTGDFEYSKPEWNPEIEYWVRESKGFLSLENEMKAREIDFDDDDRCDWYLKFNKEIKNDISIEMFAGEGIINLEDANIERFSYKMKAGDIEINLRNSSVPDFAFKAFAGEATINLSGKYNNNLYARIKGGIGELDLVLPKNVGVVMEISGFLGEINAPGFHKDDHTYINNAYHETEHTLYLDITGGIGDISVKMVD